MQLPRVDVTGAPVTALPFEEQIAAMIAWARQRSSRVVCVANVHMLMESHWDNQLKVILEKADLVTPDGMPLVWMMRSLGVQSQDRVAGMDIFMELCQRSAKNNVAIYLVGSTQDVLDAMRARLDRDFPHLKVVGAESPPFRPLTNAEDAALIDRINRSRAGITFISLGCPKQEYWMANHYGKIQSVMVGIGGVFPVYAGIKKHAPKWVRDNGLEWLYRLVQEPRRLWRRYVKTIPPFLWLACQQMLMQRKVQRSLRL